MSILLIIAQPRHLTATPPLPTVAIPGTYFGLNVLFSGIKEDWRTPWPVVPFGSLRLWASSTMWSDIEKSPRSYDWSTLDRWLHLAESHGTDVLYTFGSTPRWASAKPDQQCAGGSFGTCAPPRDIKAWEDFVRAIATHSAGRIKYWELWNEPNSEDFWRGSIRELVVMAQRAYKIIKSVDPKAKILTPSPVGGGFAWLDEYLAAGGGHYADLIAFHGYLDTRPESINSLVASYRKVLAKHRVSDKPLWDTEHGWGLNTALRDPEQQAAYLARTYLLERSNGVQRVYWYGYDNSEWGTLRVPNSGDPGTLTQAGIAYREVFHWLAGAIPVNVCSVSSDATWSCEFSRPGGYSATAVWNPKGDRMYKPALQFRRYRDLQGSSHELAGPVSIGRSPLLFETE